MPSLVGSEMCIRDSPIGDHIGRYEFATESARVLSFRLWLVVRSLPYEFAPRHKPTAADDHRRPLHNPGDSRDAAADHRSSNWDLFDVIPVERDYRRLPGAGRC